MHEYTVVKIPVNFVILSRVSRSPERNEGEASLVPEAEILRCACWLRSE